LAPRRAPSLARPTAGRSSASSAPGSQGAVVIVPHHGGATSAPPMNDVPPQAPRANSDASMSSRSAYGERSGSTCATVDRSSIAITTRIRSRSVVSRRDARFQIDVRRGAFLLL